MQSAHPVQNPFALLLNPAAVLAEVERSGRLSRLTSRICRPLDKPVLGASTEESAPNAEAKLDGAHGRSEQSDGDSDIFLL